MVTTASWLPFCLMVLEGLYWLLFQVALVVKNTPANAGDIRDLSLIPGSGRSLGGGYGNPLQYSCLENSMDRGVWKTIVHRVTKSLTWLKRLSMHTSTLMSGACDHHGDIVLSTLGALCHLDRVRRSSQRISSWTVAMNGWEWEAGGSG